MKIKKILISSILIFLVLSIFNVCMASKDSQGDEIDGVDEGWLWGKHTGYDLDTLEIKEYKLQERITTDDDDNFCIYIDRGDANRYIYEGDTVEVKFHLRGGWDMFREPISVTEQDFSDFSDCSMQSWTDSNGREEVNVYFKGKIKENLTRNFAMAKFSVSAGGTGYDTVELYFAGVQSNAPIKQKIEEKAAREANQALLRTIRSKVNNWTSNHSGRLFEANVFIRGNENPNIAASHRSNDIIQIQYPRKITDDSKTYEILENAIFDTETRIKGTDWTIDQTNEKFRMLNGFRVEGTLKPVETDFHYPGMDLPSLPYPSTGSNQWENIFGTPLEPGSKYVFSYSMLYVNYSDSEVGDMFCGKIYYLCTAVKVNEASPIETNLEELNEFEEFTSELFDDAADVYHENYERTRTEYTFYFDEGEDRDSGTFWDVFSDLSQYLPIDESADSRVISRTNTVFSIVTSIGMIVAILMLAILGIKYMLSSVEEKAEYKKDMIPYLVGAILLFGITAFLKVLQQLGNTINSL